MNCFHSSLLEISKSCCQISNFKHFSFAISMGHVHFTMSQSKIWPSLYLENNTIFKKSMIKCKFYLRQCSCYQFLYEKSKHHVTLYHVRQFPCDVIYIPWYKRQKWKCSCAVSRKYSTHSKPFCRSLTTSKPPTTADSPTKEKGTKNERDVQCTISPHEGTELL